VNRTKTWKIATISILTFTAVILTAASVFAFCGLRLGPTDGYGPLFAPTVHPAQTTQTTQNLPPVTKTNTQTPTLYTPNLQVVTPGYTNYGGWGGGCMGRGGRGPTYPTAPTTTTPLTLSQATQTATTYVTSLNNPDLKVTETEEYANNFYVVVSEQSTGSGAFELLVNKYTGVVTPEPGPNMMWNTKYTFTSGFCGWLRGTTTATPTVTITQAKTYAQQYLDSYLSGTTVGDATTFYGYYTIEVISQGNTYGMLSVNSFTGQVWYHTWHGAFIQ